MLSGLGKHLFLFLRAILSNFEVWKIKSGGILYMDQVIVYLLTNMGNLGCFPECVVVDIDNKGVFSTHFVKVSNQNISNYQHLFDETDKILFNYCLKLEKDVIVSKIKDKNAKTWEDLEKKFFKSKKLSPDTKYIKDYLVEYIEINQNDFFEHLSGKQLFLPQGKFPFMWVRLSVETEMPELLYCFESYPDWIYYSLDITCKGKPLDLKKGTLVSRKLARVLLKNKIYEFEEDVDGSKLIPFFDKEKVSVSQINADEYIQKVILPLIPSNRVKAVGFEILTVSDMSNAILRVREIAPIQQFSLFDNEEVDSAEKSIVFELMFEYQNFVFWAGQGGAITKVDMTNDSFTIYKAERDRGLEKLYVDALNEAGLNLDGKVRKMPYSEGVDWLNDNYKALESTGVEIKFEKRGGETQRIFVGERSITVEVEEGRDWFDIKGCVKFGSFEIPFVRVLNYIKQNKHQMLLPNGEYVQIPQAWFDEYKTLVDFCKIEDGKTVIAKYHCVVADELMHGAKIKLSIKDNMRRLLEQKLDKDFDLPVNFNGELRHYQQQGYNWLRLLDDLSLGGCLADDMGLGKTIQTLCLLQWMKEQKRGINMLVVPTSLVYNWEQEAAKFTPGLKVYVHTGNQRSRDQNDFKDADVLLTSYGVLRRDKHILSAFPFNYVILDEAQAIKNPQSDITQVCLSLTARRFLTLTGTPLENSLTDLWSQVHFFNRNMLGSASHFLRACKQSEKQELYRQLLKPFLLRRNKAEVLTDLPEKSIIVQWCDMSEEQQRFYRDVRNSYRDKFLESKDSNDKVNPMILLEGLLRLRQSANHPLLAEKEYTEDSGKFDTVSQMLEEVMAQGDKVLVFSSFVEHLKLYKSYLDEKQIDYCYLDGSTKDRQGEVERFQNDDKPQVFLLSLKAGGVGLNLTRASYVFLLDPWWNPAAEAQAFDRAHRIGQQNKVFVYKFITRNTIEEKILKLQEKKLQLFDAMINSDNEILKQLDVNEVMKLID
ncbi:MAG TPA: DEAD/DEAH box helicase [Paludibacter sp.]|nr:DEAD/DEAH box helicase [Paludibacter sp.]